MAKFYSSKALLKIAGGGNASPTSPPPGSAPAHPFNLQIPLQETKWPDLRTMHSCSSLKSKSTYDAIEGIDCITPPTQREINPITTIA